MPKLRVLFVSLILLAFSTKGSLSASFELAWTPDSNSTFGAIKIEGEIRPGDADRFYKAYFDYNVVHQFLHGGVISAPLPSTKFLFTPDMAPSLIEVVYLASKGGDVDEAIKIGRIIRSLRLSTYAPIIPASGGRPICQMRLNDQNNCICASACFLIYAGGATRVGNGVALHRPFAKPEDAAKLDDITHDAMLQEGMARVRTYLASMDIHQHWIDLLIATGSKDAYIPNIDEASNKEWHLMGIMPSIDEVITAKCPNRVGSQDIDMNLKRLAAAKGDEERKQMIQEFDRQSKDSSSCVRMERSNIVDEFFMIELRKRIREKCPATPTEEEMAFANSVVRKLDANQLVPAPDMAHYQAIVDVVRNPFEKICRDAVVTGLADDAATRVGNDLLAIAAANARMRSK